MIRILTCVAALTAVTLLSVGSVQATLIVDTTPDGDRHDLAADAGQTFTTPVLGLDTMLKGIEIRGPMDDPNSSGLLGPFVIELYTDNDQDPATWDPATLIGTTDSQSLIVGDGSLQSGGMTVFNFVGGFPHLNDNTVYAFTYTDGGGTRVPARVGTTNGTNGGGPPLVGTGSLFSNGATLPPDDFDTAMRIKTTVPEPATLSLFGLALMGFAAVRRR